MKTKIVDLTSEQGVKDLRASSYMDGGPMTRLKWPSIKAVRTALAKTRRKYVSELRSQENVTCVLKVTPVEWTVTSDPRERRSTEIQANAAKAMMIYTFGLPAKGDATVMAKSLLEAAKTAYVLASGDTEEDSDADEKGNEPQDGGQQHQESDEGREATEAGGGDSVEHGASVEEEGREEKRRNERWG